MSSVSYSRGHVRKVNATYVVSDCVTSSARARSDSATSTSTVAGAWQ